MVAVAGSNWKLAPSLVAFVEECDKRWPGRPTKSDGSIGDAGHAARVSDHNPDDDEADRDPTRWVCAVDLTDATPDQPQPWHILDGIRARRDKRCKYGISEGLAFYSYDKPGRPAWTWVKYSGPNGHFSHGHLSIHNTAAARDDTSSWLTGAPVSEEDEMNADDRTQLDNVRADLTTAIREVRALAKTVQDERVDTTALHVKLDQLIQRADKLLER